MVARCLVMLLAAGYGCCVGASSRKDSSSTLTSFFAKREKTPFPTFNDCESWCRSSTAFLKNTLIHEFDRRSWATKCSLLQCKGCMPECDLPPTQAPVPVSAPAPVHIPTTAPNRLIRSEINDPTPGPTYATRQPTQLKTSCWQNWILVGIVALGGVVAGCIVCGVVGPAYFFVNEDHVETASSSGDNLTAHSRDASYFTTLITT